MKTSKAVSAHYLARIFSGDESNRPVVEVPGNQPPKMVGDSYGWEKISGPNAGQRVSASYAKKWWKNIHYVGSTRQTEVGADWISARRNRAEYHEADGVRCIILPGRAARVGHIRVVPGWAMPGRGKIMLVTRGTRSYHAARTGRLSEITRATIEAAAAEARTAWAAADAAAKIDAAYRRDISTIRVTLADSRRAGNCIEGSLAFAERKLWLSREEILAAGHLFSVPAKKLLAVANGDRPRVEAAVRVAWLRETTVSI